MNPAFQVATSVFGPAESITTANAVKALASSSMEQYTILVSRRRTFYFIFARGTGDRPNYCCIHAIDHVTLKVSLAPSHRWTHT